MIISLEEFQKMRDEQVGEKKIVCTSMYADPIHPGHVSCLLDSKRFGDIFVVIVDGDTRCINKKGKAFMPAIDRAEIVDAIKGGDYGIIHENPNATDCSEVVEVVKTHIFTKGGDRNEKDRNDPNSGLKAEADIIEKYGGRIEYNVGRDKQWSSRDYLQEWVDFVNSKED